MDFPLRCRCGCLEGVLSSPSSATRAVCYCRDCQAFARFLGEPDKVLDAQGGTDVVAALPRNVRFTRGAEHLRCMSLSPQGLLRWYAGCCRTAVGNTPRNPKLSYVGLVHAFLAGSAGERDAAFGRAVRVNTGSATAPVASTPWATLVASVGIAGRLAASRLGGGFRDNPFFRAGTAEPVAAPQVLALEERRALGSGRGKD